MQKNLRLARRAPLLQSGPDLSRLKLDIPHPEALNTMKTKMEISGDLGAKRDSAASGFIKKKVKRAGTTPTGYLKYRPFAKAKEAEPHV